MFKLRPLVLALCAASAAAGCSWNQTPDKAEVHIQPVTSLRHGISGPGDMYQLGRYYQGQMRYDDAAAAYRNALAADPNFIEAHNGLGVIYSLQGNHQQAVAEFNAAIALNPKGAHLYNNLGYAYLVQGANDQAAAAFEKALALEPGNQRAMNNLETARLNMGRDEPKQVAAIPAEPAGKAARAEPAKVPAEASPAPSSAPDTATMAKAAEVHPTSEPAKPAEALVREFKLEVSNGNGINGMAAGFRGFLKRQGIATARLTNQKPFTQETTQTQYRAGYRAEAAALNAQLPKPGALVETKSLRWDIQVRLVLGKDLAQEKETLVGELARRPARPEEAGRKG